MICIDRRPTGIVMSKFCSYWTFGPCRKMQEAWLWGRLCNKQTWPSSSPPSLSSSLPDPTPQPGYGKLSPSPASSGALLQGHGDELPLPLCSPSLPPGYLGRWHSGVWTPFPGLRYVWTHLSSTGSHEIRRVHRSVRGRGSVVGWVLPTLSGFLLSSWVGFCC